MGREYSDFFLYIIFCYDSELKNIVVLCGVFFETSNISMF